MVAEPPIPKSWTRSGKVVPTGASRKIVEYLRNHQTATREELAINLHYKKPTVRISLKYLKSANMVQVKDNRITLV